MILKKDELNYDKKIVKMNERRQQEKTRDGGGGDADDGDDDEDDDDKKMIKGCNLNYNKGKKIDKTEGKSVRDGIKKKTNKNSSYFYFRLFEQIIIFVTVCANRCRRGSFVFDNG